MRGKDAFHRHPHIFVTAIVPRDNYLILSALTSFLVYEIPFEEQQQTLQPELLVCTCLSEETAQGLTGLLA
jgi:hypothetical protein